MMLALKLVLIIICVIALIFTFRTENILKTVFRVERVTDDLIFKTKLIILVVVAVLFIAAMTLK